jgi:tRNA (guanine-N7-)-methyltransferase
VRRDGRITPHQQRALETLWPRFGVEPTQPISIYDLFRRDAPLTLEIGFGNGDALATMAADAPDTDFIGIEVHRPGIGHLLLELEKRDLTNVRVINADAVEVLKQYIPPASLRRILLFFPDPWPKKRHHKRRILQPGFIDLVASRMQEEGIFHMATDWENYAQQMLALMEASRHFLNRAGRDNFSPRPDYRPVTRFEQRGKQQGHGVYDLVFQKQ